VLKDIGDGAHFCDLDGNGNDDYLFVTPEGVITIFRNQNDPGATAYAWEEHDNALVTGYDRKALHFADFDGDGLCDILATEQDNGAVYVWYTSWDADSATFSFSGPEYVENSGTDAGIACYTGWGVGLYDYGMQFADIEYVSLLFISFAHSS
jgi:FG-GAP-like repeat